MNVLKSFLLSLILLPGFGTVAQENQKSDLAIEQAERLAALPLKCAEQEYPNKMGEVFNSKKEMDNPSDLHPAFYGCFDWHSSVHGHWLMVTLVKQYPELKQKEEILHLLEEHLSKKNMEQEMKVFSIPGNASFERTYGWAWILKLQMELDSWNNPLGKECASNLRPLSQLICAKYIDFLPKLVYPIRTGEHVNTAFGLTFAYDYAKSQNDTTLLSSIVKRSREFYLKDSLYPMRFEPSGYDFLSPALEEADLMRRVLAKDEFNRWLKGFLPELFHKDFQLEPGKINDRTDGKLVHLDGLNFSRAWCLNALANTNPELSHLKTIAQNHIQASLPNIVDGDYMGEHWLASFALVALLSMR